MKVEGPLGPQESQGNFPIQREILTPSDIVPYQLDEYPLAPLLEATLDEGATLLALVNAIKKRGKIKGV